MLKRGALVVLGIGMIVVCAAGIFAGEANYMSWIEGFLGLASFLAGILTADVWPETMASLAISGLLWVLWLVGLGTHVEGWMRWSTFGFGIAYMAVGVMTWYGGRSVGEPERPGETGHMDPTAV